MDAGIIRNFKVHYRYILSNGRLAASDEGTDDIEDWTDKIETVLMKKSDSLRQSIITDFTVNQ